jgi:hypothetical protein
VSPLVGRLDFSNSIQAADGAVQGFTSREGQYFPNYLNAIFGYSGAGAGGNSNRDNSDKFKSFSGLDQETALIVLLPATPDVKMVTPVTSLLYESGTSQAKLKTQLAIVGSLFQMVNDPDLTTYDAILEAASTDATRSADAGRMSAAILRALAINTGLSAIGYRFAPESAARDVSIGYNEGGGVRLSACLRDAPNTFIFQNALMVDLAKCFTAPPAGITTPPVTLRPMTWQAIAHLVNAYSSAIGIRVETPAARARWMLGLKGYLAPAIARVAAADSDAVSTAAIAVTNQSIIDETARYEDHYTYNPTGLFMPGPDFMTIASGATQTIETAILRQTDFQFGAPNGGLGLGGTIQSVNVPTGNTTQLTAALVNTTVTVTVANGFRGVTWFDYVTRSETGEDRTARVYIRAY